MKKLSVIASLFIIASCAVDTPEKAVTDKVYEGNDFLECAIAECGTKVSLQNGTTPVWTSGDDISVLVQDGPKSVFRLFDGEGTATGTFRGTLPGGTSFCAVYPANENYSYKNGKLEISLPSEQQCTDSDFGKGASIMLGLFNKEGQGDCHTSFRNILGLLRLDLCGNSTVSRITLTSHKASDCLWGNYLLSIDGKEGTDEQTFVTNATSGRNSISITFASAVRLQENVAKPFFFALPAGTLSEGFTIEIYDQAGTIVYVKSTDKSQLIARNAVLPMDRIDGVDGDPSIDLRPDPTTWVAYNALKRSDADATVIDPQTSGYPSLKKDKYVGTFYFIWHSNQPAGGPFNIQSYLGAGNYEYNNNITYGGSQGYTCHWGEAYLGYYKATDAWVIRKHAQLLSDAGVDFIAFDVTNNSFYINEVLNLCKIYKEMRDEGNKTPQITFMIWHSSATGSSSIYNEFNHNNAVATLYNNIYSHQEYSDLWFRWEGKPLMLALKNTISNPTLLNYFTYRTCWYLWNNHAQTGRTPSGDNPSQTSWPDDDVNDLWWNNRKDYTHDGEVRGKWPWGVCYTDDTNNPMRAGRDDNGNIEFCSVAPATHPVSNLGRSYPINQNPVIVYNSGANSYPKSPEKGIYFKSQFQAAKVLDPKIMFFTGWNEWLMGHFSKGAGHLGFHYVAGVPADHMFVDQFNHEYSRDIEPLNGDFGDNYYYYMVDFIRQFRGVNGTPTYSKTNDIAIDGIFADWFKVSSAYADDNGDTKWRGYDQQGGNGMAGYNNWTTYHNTTGRNDIQICKVATDGTSLFFYLKAAAALTDYASGENGLNLYIKTSSTSSSWEGFNFRAVPASATKAELQSCGGGWNWSKVADADMAVNGECLELKVPLSELGLSSGNFSLDFKWVDNTDLSQSDGIQRCMRDGDSAPNGRFRYRYVFENNQ